jgi:hypothetical protein
MSDEYSMGGDNPIYQPVTYGHAVKISRAAYEEMLREELDPAPRKRSRWERIVAWASYRPLALVGLLGFLCGAAVVAILHFF